MAKVIKDCVARMKVLEMLNSETFEEIRKADEQDVINAFGADTPKVGRLLYKHAILEDKF